MDLKESKVMVQLDTLYKYDSTGEARFWKIQVDALQGRYRTTAGRVGTDSPIVGDWTQCKPKNIGRSNETTAGDQALKEARAKQAKQKKRGYAEDIKDSGMGFLDPMKAQEQNIDKLAAFDHVYVQPKLDGMRMTVCRDGALSRTGEPVPTAAHIVAALAPVFQVYPDLVFDGELYNHTYAEDFNSLMSIARKAKPSQEDLDIAEDNLEFHVYDCYMDNEKHNADPDVAMTGIFIDAVLHSIPNRETGFYTRFKFIHHIIMETLADCIVPVPTERVENGRDFEDDLGGAYEDFLTRKYEGMIVRADVAYAVGRRPWTMQKFKPFQDAEFVIEAIHEGVGKAAGMAKTISVRLPNGNVSKATLGGTRAENEDILANAVNVIGKEATVKFLDYTKDGMLRHGNVKVIHMEPRQ